MKALKWGMLIISLFNICIGFVLFIVGDMLKNVAGYFPTIFNTFRALAFGDVSFLLGFCSMMFGFIMLGYITMDMVKQK